MSTTVDNRVVEMRFENSQFERAASNSISTLEKLKQKLNLTGASKGLEEINAAAKNNNMSSLGAAVETVHAKFSALQVIGVTALANITNQAVNAGKKIASALTIEPVMSGFKEYETQINAVQTILANTQSKGTTIDDVNAALDELNKYADKTIYNFTEMTRNIGTFTAAGVDLDTSVSAIQGIANLAAVSGSTSQQASTAMYQLSQALAAGTVKLQDWNSVVNAGMGGEVFQNALKRTATVMGTNVDALIEKYGSFRESLTRGEWLTTDVLTETLNQFTMAAEEGTKQWDEYKASLKEKGYTEEQAIEILKMANTATDAATKVKTFTQLWDVLKEAAQSGWTQTWELIIGDFEEAKNLLTPLSDFLTGFINGMSEARNNLLKGAMESPFGKLAEKIEKVTGATEAMKNATKDYSEIVDKVIGGKYGDGQSRWNKLAEEGYDWAKVQNLVNEKLGDSTRHTEQLTEAQDKQTKTQSTTIEQLVKMNDAQLKTLGFTKDEIEAFRDLEEQSTKTGIPINDLIKDMDQLSGRSLLINSFKNAGKGLVTICKAIGDAWRDAFPPMTSKQLYDIIAAIHKFSTNLVVSTDTANKLTRTLKGVFAIIGMITDITGGGLKLAFKAVSAILGYFDTDILSVTANIGDMLVKFRKATDVSTLFSKVIEKTAPYIKDFVKNIKQWSRSFLELPKVRKFIDSIKEAFSDLKDINLKEVGSHIIEGLTNGLSDRAKQAVNTIIEIGKSIIAGICEVLGIHSPSKEFFKIGEYIIEGLINGIQNGATALWNIVKGISSKIAEFFSNINWGRIFAAGISVGMLITIKKFVDGFASLTAPLGGIGSIFESVGEILSKSTKSIGKVLKSFANVLNSFAFSIKAKALKNIAISLAILVGSIVVLTLIPTEKLWDAVKIMLALAGILAVLSFAVGKLGSTSIDTGKLSIALVGISVSLLLLASVVKKLGSLDPDQAIQGFAGLVGILGAMTLVFAGYGQLVKGKSAQNIDKAGITLLKMTKSILLMVIVIKLISGLEASELSKGFKAIAGFVVVIGLLTAITKLSGRNVDKLGNMMIRMSVSMLLMVGVIKLVSGLSAGELIKGGVAISAFVGIVALLSKITNMAGNDIDKLGSTLIGMAASMLLMVGVIKLVSGLSAGELIKGGVAILAFVGIIALLTQIVKTVGPDVPKLAGTLLAMSISLAILAGVAILLSLVDIGGLAKGLVAVGILGSVMALMIYVTKDAQDCKDNLIAMSVAIGIMAAAVLVLSFIDGKKLAGATIALGSLMGMFALIVKASSTMQNAMGSLIVMTAAVGLLAYVLYKLSDLPIEQSIATSAALSMLMVSLSAAMFIIGKAGKVSPIALLTLGTMTLIVGLLGGLLYLLKDLPIESTLNTTKSLSMLILALSGACVLLSVVGAMGPAAFIGVGALVTLIAAVGGLMVGIGALVDKFPRMEEFLNKGLPILEKIGYGLGSFFGNIVGGFSAGVTSGLPEIGTNLSTFMNNLSDFVSGAKNIDESALTGVTSLVKMMGLMSGASILEKISSWVTGGSSMDTFATQLDAFGDAITSFSAKLKEKGIDETAIQAAANAGKMMAEMAATIPGTGGVIQWFTGEKNFENFGKQLESFGKAIVAFSKTVSQEGAINETAITAAANAGKIMAEMQATIPGTGGVVQWFMGEKNFATFGAQLVAFGSAIVAFSQTVSQEGAINESAITAAANAGKIMTEMQATIIPTGGVVQAFTGEKNFATFGAQLVAFGSAIVAFSQTVSQEGAINETAVTAASTAGKIMTEMQASIVPTFGVVDLFVGSKNLVSFGGQLVLFGKALVAFSEEVSGNINSGAIEAAAKAGTLMAELQKAIPEDSWFDGKVSIDDFGKQMKKFGGHIAGYSEKVADIDTSAVSSSTSVAKKLISIVQSMTDLDMSGVKNFKVKSLGEAIKGYSDKVADLDTGKVSSSITSIKKLIGLINSMASINTSGVSSFKSAIASLGKTNVEGLTKAFNGSASTFVSLGTNLVNNIAKGFRSKQTSLNSIAMNLISSVVKSITSKTMQFTTAGRLLMLQLIVGINSQKSKVSTATSSAIKSAISGIRAYYSSFYSAGSYLVSGFANGISANSYKAAAKAKAMAKAAKEAAEEALGIHSPSKVFYGIGVYVTQGLINALSDYESKVYNASSDMAESAKKGFNGAISNIIDAMNSDMDVQPTIRPVLDLSDVRSGVNTISGLFNDKTSVGLLTNLGAISSMSNRNQNGANDDVVSAIDKLRKKLDNITSTTYNVGGISYSEGDEVSNAVKSLVRAAKVERRV